MSNTIPASVDTLHDYDHELSAAYDRVESGQTAPRITNPDTAYEIGHELVRRLGDVDEKYRNDLEGSRTAKDPAAAMVEDMTQRDEGIKRTVSIIESKHRRAAPINFINGERHYGRTQLDPAMEKRFDKYRQDRAETQLGRQINDMGLDRIDPSYKSTNIMRMDKGEES